MVDTVGIVGLGIMGGAMARNLLAAGVEVVGFDVSLEASQRLAEEGGRPLQSVAEVAAVAPKIITSVATSNAFRQVMEELAPAARPGQIVVEASTMALTDKEWAYALLAEREAILLDCPISGTGAQAEARDLVFLASGDSDAIESVKPILEKLGKAVHDLGVFGSGSKMKFVANLLVGIHNVATAEAMVLAERAGIDPGLVEEVLRDSAASSRIFQLRFPLMVDNRYSPPTAKISMFIKDLDLISGYAAEVGSPTPLLDAVRPLYEEAAGLGMADLDAAAVCSVLERRAGIER
jgi:3-hydroxyisobutyrate dehydrogenase-like beta-hydroxyacid dehydrogenase